MKLKSKKPPMKPEEAKLLEKQLAGKIQTVLQGMVEELSTTRSSFLRAVPVKRALSLRKTQDLYTLFEHKMQDARLWKPVRAMLLKDRFAQLLAREIERYQRSMADPRQMLLGFENLPRTIDVVKLTVKDFLARASRYEKRANKNRIAAFEMSKLADLIRDQPLDLSVPEALARATAPVPAVAR